jgi:hypothetical protein
MSNIYRYQLEKYRGRGTRHVCPQCHRKRAFTRYIDTHNNNIYISENVGKCNRIDKCGYHYTPKQYYTDNPWKRGEGELEKDIGNFTKSPSPYSNFSTFSKSCLPTSGHCMLLARHQQKKAHPAGWTFYYIRVSIYYFSFNAA